MKKSRFKILRWVLLAIIIVVISVFGYYYSLIKDIPDVLGQLKSDKTKPNTQIFTNLPPQASFSSPQEKKQTAQSAEVKIKSVRRASYHNELNEQTLSQQELNAFLQQLIESKPEVKKQFLSKGITNPVIRTEGNGFVVDGVLTAGDKQIPIQAELKIISLDGYLAAQIVDVRIRGKSLPGFIVKEIASRFSSGQDNIRIALPASIGSVKVENGLVKIGSRVK